MAAINADGTPVGESVGSVRLHGNEAGRGPLLTVVPKLEFEGFPGGG